MSGFATRAIRTLVSDRPKAQSVAAGSEVWNLNLDQIESHGGRVLEKIYVNTEKLGPSTFAFEPRTVLYSKLRPYLNKVVVADEAGFATTELVPLRCNPEEVHPEYLAYFLRSEEFLRFATEVVAGAKMPRMVMSEFWNFQVPLPSLPEQRRIAAILDQAHALRAKRREALAQLDSLTQSIFIEMFGDPVMNPMGWQIKSLDDVADFFAGNSLPDGVPFVGQKEGFFLMKVSDMNLEGNEKTIEGCQAWSSVSGSRSGTCPAGSIVIPKRGGAIGTNKKRITTRETILDPNLMAISPKLTIIEREYLFQWFQRFDLSSISSGSSVPQLNKQDLIPLKIQVPPLRTQKTFVSRIHAVQTIKTKNTAALRELNTLFTSLQHRAFQGEL